MCAVCCRFVAPALQRFVQQGLQQELLPEVDKSALKGGAAAAVGGGQEGTAADTAAVSAGSGWGSSKSAGQEVPADQVVGLLKQQLGLR
jgi:hypothetical protein